MTKKRSRILAWAAMYAVILLLVVMWMYPIGVAITKSFAIGGVENYHTVLNHDQFHYWLAVMNSVVIAGGSTVVIVAIGTCAAFAFSTMNFRGRDFLYRALLVCLAVPVVAVVTPLFFTINSVGLRDTRIGVMLPLIAFNVIIMVMLLKNSFDGVPKELIEASIIDGANPFTVFWRIYLPLSVPAIANVSVLSFVYCWNEYLLPNLLLSDTRKFPVTTAVSLLQFERMSQEQIGQLYAGLILLSIPSVIVYMFSQRYLQAGLTAGAVKS